MRHSEFSYDNLNTQSNRKAGVYSTTPVNTSFFALCHDHAPMDRVTGWKFHISVAQQDVGKAWNLVADYLIDQNIGQAKVATPGCAERFSNPESHQSGKMITVYDFGLGHDWQRMTQDIESMLEQNGIRPGHAVKGDRSVNGSRYTSYRNDRMLDGRYVDAKESAQYPPHQQYNISGRPDPFANIRVAPVNQGRWVNAVMDGKTRPINQPNHAYVGMPAVPPPPRPPQPPQPPQQGASGIPAAKHWKAQVDQFDNPLMSLPIDGAPVNEVAKVKALLRLNGFTPEERVSKSMGGRVVYVSGEDATRLKNTLGTPPKPNSPRPSQSR